ncbi:ATP-binding protein [Beggiatoa alba]|nr:ATP-binding protein [Beggiatoa alba]
MLIEFTVTNFRSIKTEQSFSLVKGKGEELEWGNVFQPSGAGNPALLHSAAIYGPNAAGKSNLVKALQTMRDVVVESATKMQHGDELPVISFRLDVETEQAPSQFEVVFVVDGVRYQYGFAATRSRVTGEWLLAFPKGPPQRWFSRVWDEARQMYDWKMGQALSGQKQLWRESTRPNALFLSTAVQLNSEQLQPVYNWFSRTLRIAQLGGWGSWFTASLCENPGSRERVVDFLKAADLDIHDVQVTRKKFDVHSLPDDMPSSLKTQLVEELNNKDMMEIKTLHQTAEGRTVLFDFDDESDGTQKLFAFAGPWLDSLEHGFVLFVDELHYNLHPKLVRFLIELFHSPETNPNNAQLVFTTHETSILSQEVFRRDQIWFCEKDGGQATEVIPLSDFSPRKNRENLEMSYLAGRYGALPYIRKLKTA